MEVDGDFFAPDLKIFFGNRERVHVTATAYADTSSH